MQQAVNTSTSLVTLSSSATLASLLGSAINRSGLDKIKLLVDTLKYHLAAAHFGSLFSDKSFFENRHGFTHSELLDCEYVEPSRRRLSGLLFNKSSTPLYQQHRGFKTKRIVGDRTGGGDQGDLSSEFKNIFSSLSSSSSQSSGGSSLKRFGSLLEQTRKNSKSDSKQTDDFLASSSGTEQEKKLKLAFTEGVLFGSSRADIRRTAWRLVLFFAVLLFFFFPLSVSFNGSNGGRNGSGSGGGINLRTLTGNVDYEVNAENVTVKFEDVKGVKDAKKELMEIVDFLKDPEQYTKIGARLPKGVLLVGPPGCGKTMLAKAVAGEAGVPFFQANGSDFDEMFVGTGSKRVRSLFAAARAKAPCVIFIDEIDSVGSKRTNSTIHPHANQTINQLLAEMDGFKKNEGIIVLGATNRRETLDNALMRPGRFDLEVRVDRPDLEGRVQILESYLDKVARDPDIDINLLAKQLTGLGGSGIENVVNQAALRAATTKSTTVKMEHLEWAVDRARMGYGKTRLQDEESNRVTAYHEAGHALVGYFTRDADPLHKVTILPRSQSLGHTSFVPDKDQYSITRSQLLAQMDVSFGGRVAEEMIFGVEKVTTGAYADYQRATSIATDMIKSHGMSDKLGPRTFGSDDPLSLQTQEIIDGEIKKTLTDSYERARNIIKSHSYELKLIAEALLIHETLDSEQVKRLIENHKL